MKPWQRGLFALLAMVAAGAAALAWREHAALARLRAEGVTPEERQRLQQAAWNAARRADELAARLRRATAAAGASGGLRSAGTSQVKTLGDFAAQWLGRMDDPEVRRLMDTQRRAQIARQFAAFFHEARLTPDQIAAFERLMLERGNVQADVLLAATQQGINPMDDPDSFRQMIRSAQADIDGQLKTALGDATYAQYQAFQQTQGQRNVTGQLQQDLRYTDTPLTDAQRQQVQQIVAQSNPNGGSDVTDTTIALARGVLSAPQVAALQNLQQLQQTNRQLQQAMQQARGGAAPAP